MVQKLRFIIGLTYPNGLAFTHYYSKKQGAIMNARMFLKRAPAGAKVTVTDSKTGEVIHTEERSL
jgi:hypothetical protein